MPSREFELRVRDMLTEIFVVEETVSDLSFEAFIQNRQALRAVLYCLAVIAELTQRLSNGLHDYLGGIDLERVWDAVAVDLPGLEVAARRLMEE